MTAAALLQAHNVTVETPEGRALVRDLCVRMGNERVAIVGRNGVGKSSLLGVLAGQSLPAQGRVVCRGTRLLVPQQLESEDWMSPGERRRAHLEDALRAQPDLLMLDEPTLDLDEENIGWLSERSRAWPGALLVVSHDKRVLRGFEKFLVVAEAGCRYFEGGFEALRAELARDKEARDRRYAQEIHRLETKERHSDVVRSRRQRKKNLGRLHELKRCPARIKLNDKRSYKQESQGKRAVIQKTRLEAVREGTREARRALPVELALELRLPTLPPPPLTKESSDPVVLCEGVAAVTQAGTLFEDVSFSLHRERVSLRGRNGSGKTTLLEIAMGLREPAAGRARCDRARCGYVAQNGGNWQLDESLVELLSLHTRDPSLEGITALLRAHRFPRALAARPLATLSPGERIRAALIGLTQRRPAPEVLVLDEPTQHLDFVGTAALEAVLAAWPGGLLVVSHDPEFLAAVGIDHTLDMG